MWLKEIIERKNLQMLQEKYSRADRVFMLKNGLKIYPSYINKSIYHLVGYVQKSYNVNGTTFIELTTANNRTLTITAPKYTNTESLEFESILCVDVVEHHNGILDNSVFARTCSKVVIL